MNWAASLLHEEMADQGCDIYYDDEVQLFLRRSKLTGVGLRSGRKINCDAMILAIGTTPNLEIAKDCGLDCKRGVIVNERLQTSDPSIYMPLAKLPSLKALLWHYRRCRAAGRSSGRLYERRYRQLLQRQFVYEYHQNTRV
jgi:hypothetical protein